MIGRGILDLDDVNEKEAGGKHDTIHLSFNMLLIFEILTQRILKLASKELARSTKYSKTLGSLYMTARAWMQLLPVAPPRQSPIIHAVRC